ncbi:fimbrial biogenesis chaperone, partial [Rahnella aceris]
ALGVSGFQPFMIAPKGEMPLGVTVASVGKNPVLTYINDYGARPQLLFNCAELTCKLLPQGNKT